MPVGGKLVLKGGLNDKKKKKKKRDREDYEQPASHPDKDQDQEHSKGEDGGHNHEGGEGSTVKATKTEDSLTPAQRRHLERQRRRDAETIKKLTHKTHRERIEDYNQYLSTLTEHNDIPRVSVGYGKIVSRFLPALLSIRFYSDNCL